MSQTEEDLISACQSGDTQAFGELYDAYVRKLYDFIYYKTSRKEIAEDLTSVVFMKALQNITKYHKTDTGSFSGWLYSIARNTIIDHYRSVRPNDNIDDAFDLPFHARIEERTEASLQIEKIHTYLKKLPSLQRDIILMRVWQDLPYKTIATAVGKTEDNCKVIYSRSIKELRLAFATGLVLTLLYLPHVYGF
ncbi:MAG: sigma-70 family RNA polymerase sigma factor [Patescibacteria group bacterium]